jgi:RimJ/RimL family protein N-acetyltransferase
MESYRLVPLAAEHIPVMFGWHRIEKHDNRFTCRPVRKIGTEEQYAALRQKDMNDPAVKTYVLVRGEKPLAYTRLFDYNPRNRSAEFGYYMPECNRGAGNGSRMMELFLKEAFTDESLALHKLYATTSAGNIPSNRLLQKFGFHLDGRLREHYWVDGQKYDQMTYSLLRTEWKT